MQVSAVMCVNVCGVVCSQLKKFSDLLLNADVDVRITAGEAIALLYETARADDEVRHSSVIICMPQVTVM